MVLHILRVLFLELSLEVDALVDTTSTVSLVEKNVVKNPAAQLIGQLHRRLPTTRGNELYGEGAVSLTVERDGKRISQNLVVVSKCITPVTLPCNWGSHATLIIALHPDSTSPHVTFLATDLRVPHPPIEVRDFSSEREPPHELPTPHNDAKLYSKGTLERPSCHYVLHCTLL